MRRVGSAAVLAVLLLARPAAGHPAPFSYIDVHVAAAGEVSAVVHVFDVAHDLHLPSPDPLLTSTGIGAHAARIVTLLRDRMLLEIDGRPAHLDWSLPEPLPERQSLRLRSRYDAGRNPGRVALSVNLFPYDPQHQTFVNVYERGTLRSQAILGGGRQQLEYFAGTRQGAIAVMQKFVPAGFHHILIGPDHLLFLFGLLLLGGSLRRLALVVTAFTLAHSVTLTLAALDIFTPPTHIVEPAIALSIVYVGADNLLVRGGRDVRVWIAFGFGLIHGFGFANVLREMDLPPSALAWSLFSFNLGIEIGQLLVVGAVATALATLRTRSAEASRRLAFAGSIAVIAAGAFWFIQRVFFSGGMA
jgi:hydrogenase/urease accessory protein HupE